MNNIGQSIKEHRLEAGKTLLNVQQQTGISNQNLSRWENGKAIPGVDFCIKLAKFYDVSLDELVGLTDYDSTPKNKAITEQPTKSLSTFENDFQDILDDNNFIQTAKLFKAAKPELRAIAFGYLVGLFQSNGVNTKSILGY